MDRVIGALIRCIVWLAKYTAILAKFGIGKYEKWQKGEKIKFLLVGYNGVRNTGADARVVALVEQIENVFGSDRVQISVMTLVLENAVELCKDILVRMGVNQEDIFLGTVNAGHPGGMLPLTAEDKETLHNKQLPQNLYVADATILPKSMGNPPILTIMALAKRIARIIKERWDFIKLIGIFSCT